MKCDHCGNEATREVLTVKQRLWLCVRCAERWWADYLGSVG